MKCENCGSKNVIYTNEFVLCRNCKYASGEVPSEERIESILNIFSDENINKVMKEVQADE